MTPPRSRAGRARPGGPTTGRSSFSPCLALRWCRLVHAVEVALEGIEVSGPEAAVRLCKDCEHRCHGASILHRAYTCQGIYTASVTARDPLKRPQGVVVFDRQPRQSL